MTTGAWLRIVVMGVSGTGKTTVGQALAVALGGRYLDGDDLHPAANVAKMAQGEPLTDADRAPWLVQVARVLHDGTPPILVGCSALKRSYRDVIRAGAGGPVTFVHLTGDRAVIAARMGARQGHFMPTRLLDSQFGTLEVPGADETAIPVDIDQSVEAIVKEVLAALDRQQRG